MKYKAKPRRRGKRENHNEWKDHLQVLPVSDRNGGQMELSEESARIRRKKA